MSRIRSYETMLADRLKNTDIVSATPSAAATSLDPSSFPSTTFDLTAGGVSQWRMTEETPVVKAMFMDGDAADERGEDANEEEEVADEEVEDEEVEDEEMEEDHVMQLVKKMKDAERVLREGSAPSVTAVGVEDKDVQMKSFEEMQGELQKQIAETVQKMVAEQMASLLSSFSANRSIQEPPAKVLPVAPIAVPPATTTAVFVAPLPKPAPTAATTAVVALQQQPLVVAAPPQVPSPNAGIPTLVNVQEHQIITTKTHKNAYMKMVREFEGGLEVCPAMSKLFMGNLKDVPFHSIYIYIYIFIYKYI